MARNRRDCGPISLSLPGAPAYISSRNTRGADAYNGLSCLVFPPVATFGSPQPGRRMSQSLLAEYFPILLFLGIATAISAVAVGLSYLVAEQKPDSEKVAAFECGFDAFEDARSRFDVRFYLVAILFIIFDLEVAFLFPWAISLGDIGMFGFWSMVVFLAILTVGFVYEWRKGALEWE